jgi:hypothetical protein
VSRACGVAQLGAWVPERWIIAGTALGEDAAKIAAGWERVEGGWVVARRPVRGGAMTGWDFARGGEAAPRVRPDLAGLPGACDVALSSAAARECAVGAVVALRGVAVRYGLAWRVEAQGASVHVRGRRAAVLVWRGGRGWVASRWRGEGPAGEALAGIG